ncbi:MAG TPA: sialate O-acetylesterase, partial [Verrucomicrobiae bacterium]|nr:sialate O-acetylesterase [Verrucomicrobiae bacterium]
QSAWSRLDTNMLHDSMFGIKPATLYNAMIAPFAQTPFAGVIWYQGEGNAGQPAYYPTLLTTLIGEWRQQFQQPKLPFFIVQLPDYLPDWGGYYWTWIREAQAKTVHAVPHTSLIVGIETTDGTNLHPKQKQEIGRRAALQARQVVYHEDLTATGPVFKTAKVKGATIEVTFTTAGSPLVNNSTNALQGFTLAGADGIYHPATAKIDGNTVTVQSIEVPAPKTVRYAWSGVPHSTLRNQAGLPAAPFRTDSLPIERVEPKK